MLQTAERLSKCTEFVEFKQDNFRDLLGKKPVTFA